MFIFSITRLSLSGSSKILKVAERAVKFDFSNDDSAGARVRKFLLSFEQSGETGYIFGPGMLSMEGTWYDGLIPSINLFMGGFGIVFVLVLPFYILYVQWKKSQISRNKLELVAFTYVLLIYFLANFITEYFLVTRSILPISTFLALLSFCIYKSDQLIANEN